MDFARDIDPVLLAEISKTAFYPVGLVRIDWPDEVIELHTGAGTIAFDGGTFLGTIVNNQSLGQIEVPSEEPGLRASEVTLSLYGPYAELLDRMDPDATGRAVTIWAGATTEPGGNVLVGTPHNVFNGTISGDLLPAPTNDGSSGLSVRAKAGTHGRVKGAITHSNEEHQASYPDDTFFERSARASAYKAAQPKW